MPEHDTNHLAYIKNISAAVTALLPAFTAAISFWKQEFDPSFLMAIAGSVISLSLIYVYAKRDLSTLQPNTWVYQYSRRQRRWALAGAMIVVFLSIAFWICFLPKPMIERIIPPDPIAGDRLQIFGSNLSGSAGVEVAFADAKVSEYFQVGRGFVEVKVPQSAKTGPLNLKSKGRITLADRYLVYPIITIQDKGNRFQLITEDIRPEGDNFKIKFSAVNNGSSAITITGIQLRIVAVKKLPQANLALMERVIDLGTIFFIESTPNSPRKVNLFKQHRVEFLDDRLLIRLRPRESMSFMINLLPMRDKSHVKLVFAIAMSYLDGANGGSGLVFGSRLFSLESGDLVGMKSSHDLAFNPYSISILQQEYGPDFISDSLEP